MHKGVHLEVHPCVGKSLIISDLLVRGVTGVLVKYAVFLKWFIISIIDVFLAVKLAQGKHLFV